MSFHIFRTSPNCLIPYWVQGLAYRKEGQITETNFLKTQLKDNVKTKIGEQSFCINSGKLWNNIPAAIKESRNLKISKSWLRRTARQCQYQQSILQRIQEIEADHEVDLTNINQHGFKKQRSTTSAGQAIQSALARALDEGKFALIILAIFDLIMIYLVLSFLHL